MKNILIKTVAVLMLAGSMYASSDDLSDKVNVLEGKVRSLVDRHESIEESVRTFDRALTHVEEAINPLPVGTFTPQMVNMHIASQTQSEIFLLPPTSSLKIGQIFEVFSYYTSVETNFVWQIQCQPDQAIIVADSYSSHTTYHSVMGSNVYCDYVRLVFGGISNGEAFFSLGSRSSTSVLGEAK